MDNAKQVLALWEKGEIHFTIPLFWSVKNKKPNPVDMAKICIASRRWMWPVVVASILAIFVAAGWPFGSEEAWLKAIIITLISSWMIIWIFALDFMGYTMFEDFLDSLESIKYSTRAQTALQEITRTKKELDRVLRNARPNWRMGKDRIRRRASRRRRLMRKTSS